MKDNHGNTLVVNRKAVAIYGAILAVIAIVLGIAYKAGVIGGEYLPTTAAGVHRMAITYDTTGSPSVEAPDAIFNRRDGAAVTVSLDPLSNPGDGKIAFEAWVGTNPDNERVSPITIEIGQSAVLDGVRVTVVAIWTGSKYRSDAVDLKLADASS
jgi:hypothetical protein